MRFNNFDPTFSEESFSDMANSLNTLLRRIGTDNISGEIATVEIPAGIELAIPHNLKVTPKYRIILRNTGEFNIGDGDTPWTDKTIYLKNSGASTATLSILILRG